MVAIPGMPLIGGIPGAGVDGMGWWPGGGPFGVVKLKAVSTTVSPAAAQAAATVRVRKYRRAGSVIENLLPADQARRQAVRRAAGGPEPRAASGPGGAHDIKHDSGVIVI